MPFSWSCMADSGVLNQKDSAKQAFALCTTSFTICGVAVAKSSCRSQQTVDNSESSRLYGLLPDKSSNARANRIAEVALDQAGSSVVSELKPCARVAQMGMIAYSGGSGRHGGQACEPDEVDCPGPSCRQALVAGCSVVLSEYGEAACSGVLVNGRNVSSAAESRN